MKVLFYSYAYPNPIQPGLGTFNRSMIAGLAAEHDVRVVSPVPFVDVWQARLSGKLPGLLNDPGFSAVPNVPAEYVTYYYTPRILRSQYGRWMDLSVRRRLNQTIKSFQPDVVLSYWAHPDGEVAVRTAHRHGIPAVAMAGGSDVLLLGRSGSRKQKILDVMQNADAVVTVSDHIARTLVDDGLDPARTHVVRRGVDRALFSPGDKRVARRGLGIPENRTTLISVGRLVPVKGHSDLLQACRLLAARRVAFRCYLLGDGPLRGDLQKQIQDLGLSGVVELKGSQTQAQLTEWYRAADLTVLSSLSEGVPNVLMESVSCGTPFVATDVGGVSEIADERHDRMVPPSCPVALADAIEWQLKVRHDTLPTRTFEPLPLRAAGKRLTQVLEHVISDAGPVATQWQTFHPSEAKLAAAEVRGDAPCNLQNSLPAATIAMTQPYTVEEQSEIPERENRFDHKICLPSRSLYAEELGRTGEEYVLPQR